MSQSRADQLVREIFGLYSKYGYSEFERAIKMLESGASVEILLRIMRVAKSAAGSLAHGDNAARRSTKNRKKSPRERLAEFISDLPSRAGDQSDVVARFVSDIAERKLLQNAAMLREYSRRLGLPVDAKMDRAIVARKIGDALLIQSQTMRKDSIELAAKLGTEKSSLQEWSDVIVKGHR